VRVLSPKEAARLLQSIEPLAGSAAVRRAGAMAQAARISDAGTVGSENADPNEGFATEVRRMKAILFVILGAVLN
jgi:hypothetical protein